MNPDHLIRWAEKWEDYADEIAEAKRRIREGLLQKTLDEIRALPEVKS